MPDTDMCISVELIRQRNLDTSILKFSKHMKPNFMYIKTSFTKRHIKIAFLCDYRHGSISTKSVLANKLVLLKQLKSMPYDT